MIWETPDGLRVLDILAPKWLGCHGGPVILRRQRGAYGRPRWMAEEDDAGARWYMAEVTAAAILERAAREYLHAHHHFVMPAECRPGICYLLIDFHAADTLEDLAFRAPRFETYAEALIAGVLKIAEDEK